VSRPFTRAELNTDVRVRATGEIGNVVNIDADGLVLIGRGAWYRPEDIERGRVVKTWVPEADADSKIPALHVREAFRAFKALTDAERQQITCWFCRGCARYIGPGDTCHCENDE